MTSARAARIVSLVLALGLAAPAVYAAEAPTEEGMKAAARALYESGKKHHAAKRYKKALADYGKAYELFPTPVLKFNMAQATRLKGDPVGALRLYREYLLEAPEAENRALVEELVAELVEEVGPEAAAAAVPASTGTPEPDPAPDPDPPIIDTTPTVTPSPVDATPVPSKRKKGFPVWAGVVIGVVAAGAVAGAVVLGVVLVGRRSLPELGYVDF